MKEYLQCIDKKIRPFFSTIYDKNLIKIHELDKN